MIKTSFAFVALCSLLFALLPSQAMAEWAIVDALNIAPFVPIVLDAMMSVAMTGYEFFVGAGDGIIYIMVWTALVFVIVMYLIKMWFPKSWLTFFGFSDGGQMYEKGIGGIELGTTLLKPAIRAIVAAAILLPIQPRFITEFIVDPFLQFGALYTHEISKSVCQDMPWGCEAPGIECPGDIVDKGYLSAASCSFLVQPVADLSYANNHIIKRGLEMMGVGLAGAVISWQNPLLMATELAGIGGVPGPGQSIMNVITGILLIITFVSSNFFMALLIIQGIFNFGMQLILYPFNVLNFVIRDKGDKWIDLWPPFKDLIEALKKLVITMIACAFILVINMAIVRSLVGWNGAIFEGAAGGANMGFGAHSVVWLSAIMTFFLMLRIFELTRKKLEQYAGKDMTGLHGQVTGDFKALRGNLNKGTRKGLELWKKYIRTP